jgi:hypothetical protein
MIEGPEQRRTHPGALAILARTSEVALAFVCIFLAYNLRNSISRLDTFRRVHVGMDRKETVRILMSDNVRCEGYAFFETEHEVCRFEDYWREYRFTFDPENGHIVAKRMSFKPVTPLLR